MSDTEINSTNTRRTTMRVQNEDIYTESSTGYGPRGINLDKLGKIPFLKEDIFVDFKHQFLAALEGKRLKKFVTDRNYDQGLPEDDHERLMQVFVYNSIAAS